MDLRAAADTLDDLLPQVTAFAEVDRLQLVGFLDQIPLGDFLAVTWAAAFDSHRAGVVIVALVALGVVWMALYVVQQATKGKKR